MENNEEELNNQLDDEAKAEVEAMLKFIRDVRKQRNYTQEYVAKKLGMTQNGYKNIENGQRELKYSTLVKILKILEVDIQQNSDKEIINFDPASLKNILFEIQKQQEEIVKNQRDDKGLLHKIANFLGIKF